MTKQLIFLNAITNYNVSLNNYLVWQNNYMLFTHNTCISIIEFNNKIPINWMIGVKFKSKTFIISMKQYIFWKKLYLITINHICRYTECQCHWLNACYFEISFWYLFESIACLVVRGIKLLFIPTIVDLRYVDTQ
jgi:hypothetical protein